MPFCSSILRGVAVLIGLFVAASFGSGDFLGGLASRHGSMLRVLWIVQVTGLIAATVVAVSVGDPISANAIALGAGAGLLNVTGLGCLYQGLAIGQIGQVAPVAAVIGAIVPVTWGLATGERPSSLALAGAGLAIVAAAVICMERTETPAVGARKALPLAVGAGSGFGTAFILLAYASRHPGFWPVISARAAAVVAVGGALVIFGSPRLTSLRPRRMAFFAGLLDATGTVLLLIAVRKGLAAVVAPVANLTPAFTVMLAWWVLRERATRVQIAGLVVGLVGLVLIAIG